MHVDGEIGAVGGERVSREQPPTTAARPRALAHLAHDPRAAARDARLAAPVQELGEHALGRRPRVRAPRRRLQWQCGHQEENRYTGRENEPEVLRCLRLKDEGSSKLSCAPASIDAIEC